MTRRTRTCVSIVLFILIFAGLLVTATFTDLQISNILTANSLSAHTYLTDDAFGASFESFGSAPVYMMFGFGFQILFWYCLRKKTLSSAPRYLLACGMAVCNIVAYYVFTDETLGYVLEHLGREDAKHAGYLTILVIVMTLFISTLGLIAVRNFSDAQTEKLFSYAVALIVFAAVSTIILHLIKGPVGRIRFRAMNMYPDSPDYGFNAYQRWFDAKGQWIPKDQMLSLFGTTDALKSFPSGHTCAAGASYGLVMLNDALGIKNKKIRALFWIFPILFTAAVAISRIVVGAHFFSDVLVGGTCAFVCMILSREIFILKGANVKALFGKEA